MRQNTTLSYFNDAKLQQYGQTKKLRVPNKNSIQHFILSSKSAFTTRNNAGLGTEQKWDANKENNKIRIYKHIKTGVGSGAGDACVLRSYLQIN